MAVRTALLTSRNINLDTDFSKYIESVTTAGIISGFTVTASSVAAGTAWVPCTRTNGDTIYALVQNFSAVTISGNGHVIIKVDDTIVDNGGGNEDGTGIATISVVANLPSKNYLELATISSGTVTPVAPTIKKLNELNTEIESIFSQLADLDERVEALEEADAIDHLEESGLVWELYTLEDTLFKQYAPTLANSTIEANVWDVAANTEIHIQAIGSGEASNTLKLKVKMAGSPTTSLVAEVRKGIQVTVTENVEAYWYGDSNNILATGTLASSSFSSDWAEVTFTLDNAVGGTKWELLDVVVYQTTGSGATVNASNYYVLACDSTQYSEGFSYVSVNGSTRARSKLMPYLSSVWFVQAMLSKTKESVKTLLKDFWQLSRAGGEYVVATATLSKSSVVYVEITNITFTAASMTGYICFWVNGGNIFGMTNATSNGSWSAATPSNATALSWVLPAGTFQVYLQTNNSSNSILANVKAYTIEYTMVPYGAILYPKDVKEIWEQGITILYGNNDKDFIGGIMLDEDTTVTTWNITPSNFVGYIRVLFNGKYVKIPYYNE